jgi:hypothetical protein
MRSHDRGWQTLNVPPASRSLDRRSSSTTTATAIDRPSREKAELDVGLYHSLHARAKGRWQDCLCNRFDAVIDPREFDGCRDGLTEIPEVPGVCDPSGWARTDSMTFDRPAAGLTVKSILDMIRRT